MGLLVDARGGERLTPSHAVKKGRRYRYYVSAALITDAGTDHEGWRLSLPKQLSSAVNYCSPGTVSWSGFEPAFGPREPVPEEVRFARTLRWRKPDSNHRSRGRPPPSS